MCIIAAKPQGFTIDDSTIEIMWENNSDGGGFMYAKDETLFVIKGLMTLEEFKKAYKVVGTLPAVLHFRIKTHGKLDKENTHPFRVSDKIAVVHNGVINNITCEDKDKSDTWHFTEKVLKPLCRADGKFILRPYNKELLSGYINSSKLTFLDNLGHINFINEAKGEWKDGVWFSNGSWGPRKKPTPAPVMGTVSDWYGRGDRGGYYHNPSDSSYLSIGDTVEVIKVRHGRSGITVGEVGMVESQLQGGWLRILFHQPTEDGTVIERSLPMHEDDLTYKYMFNY
jgi:hypothetical protein